LDSDERKGEVMIPFLPAMDTRAIALNQASAKRFNRTRNAVTGKRMHFLPNQLRLHDKAA
jgi:hypothetical protein